MATDYRSAEELFGPSPTPSRVVTSVPEDDLPRWVVVNCLRERARRRANEHCSEAALELFVVAEMFDKGDL